ncbi:SOS response-associated peptidase [Leptolyngbya sp. FACHB-321]|uniref:SOS response-associated peptidase n=1 Tax=Leptolyngbya sp. FACHB-321 TaxID=2692807 RepID=UPI0016866540|nr:SOS response-associated peptidase [Leptolyngbya sp. FACHB-321]MBD2034211.1 SOS response-associated peptidase [Leptolyngbya sp. FACHB-321]
MCGRFSLTQSANALAETFQLETLPEWTPRYNVAPTQAVMAIAAAPTHSRQVRLFRWGLVPGWAKDLTIGAKLINARAETVAEKPSFRAAFKQRRCLILADGFYEWHRIDHKTKQPYYFQLSDRQPFAFAGLWERWQGDDTAVETCTILTTQANELLQPIHDRMPVILAPEEYDRWLDPTEIPDHHTLLHPYDAALMRGDRVSTLVNRATNDSPDCVNTL